MGRYRPSRRTTGFASITPEGEAEFQPAEGRLIPRFYIDLVNEKENPFTALVAVGMTNIPAAVSATPTENQHHRPCQQPECCGVMNDTASAAINT